MDFHATTFSDLETFSADHAGWLFRGHGDASWVLQTTLERAAKRHDLPQWLYEKKIYNEFLRHAHNYLRGRIPPQQDTFEWLALMQHHGAPTRLLDFTFSFWIGVFFAYEDALKDCAVVALDPVSLRPCLDGEDYNRILLESIYDRQHADPFLRQNVPYFTNERLAIQKGTFVFALDLNRTFQELVMENEKRVDKLIIPCSLFAELRERLNDFNCNSRVLFPGIDGYARYFKNYSSD